MIGRGVRHQLAISASLAAFIVESALGVSAAWAATPQPAGSTPSPIAKMVCATKAATEIDEVLGEKASVSNPTWKNHLYSCDYRFKSGTMVLSVKELSSASQTSAYFDGLAQRLHKSLTIYGLSHSEGAFRTEDGSVVVRKDYKVLVVDVSGLPRHFGEPETGLDEVSLTVAGVIMGCWNGD